MYPNIARFSRVRAGVVRSTTELALGAPARGDNPMLFHRTDCLFLCVLTSISATTIRCCHCPMTYTFTSAYNCLQPTPPSDAVIIQWHTSSHMPVLGHIKRYTSKIIIIPANKCLQPTPPSDAVIIQWHTSSHMPVVGHIYQGPHSQRPTDQSCSHQPPNKCLQ